MYTFKNNLLILLVSLVTLSSCSSIKTLSNGKQIDKKLVGVWQGSESGKQFDGIQKEWEMIRSDDGTYTVHFTAIFDGESEESFENGNWWIEGDKFCEYHANSDLTDIYKYVVLNKDQIQFEMISTEMKFAVENYIFIDNRVSGNKSKKSVKDGLSVENAIKVKSVADEYDFVRSNCKNCQLLGQSLINHNGKAYDELRLKKEDGQEVSYYFDISSFYGKW